MPATNNTTMNYADDFRASVFAPDAPAAALKEFVDHRLAVASGIRVLMSVIEAAGDDCDTPSDEILDVLNTEIAASIAQARNATDLIGREEAAATPEKPVEGMVDEFNDVGCKLEQLRAGIRVFRCGFQNVKDVDADAYLAGLEQAAESLGEQFGDLVQRVEFPPEPQPEI